MDILCSQSVRTWGIQLVPQLLLFVDQHLCFCCIDTTIPLLSKSEISSPLSIVCGCTGQFVSYLVGNPKDRFSHNTAHMIMVHLLVG